jgi:hypothetical protein
VANVEALAEDMPLQFFLLRHDRVARVTEIRQFVDPLEAEQAYDRLEREPARSDQPVDIVLVGSDSLQTVKRTHASYFRGQELVEA